MFESIFSTFATIALSIGAILGTGTPAEPQVNFPKIELVEFGEVNWDNSSDLDDHVDEGFDAQSEYQDTMDEEVSNEKEKQEEELEQHSSSTGTESGESQNTGTTPEEPANQTEEQKTDAVDEEEAQSTEPEDTDENEDSEVDVDVKVPSTVKDTLDQFTRGIGI